MAVAFLLAGAPLYAAGSAALDKRITEANAKIGAGEFQAAIELCNQILQAEPAADAALVARAFAKWRLKDVSGARADLTHAIKLRPDSFHAYRLRAQLHYETKDYQGSLADLNESIRLVELIFPLSDGDEFEKGNADLWGLRGEVQLKLGDRKAALRDLDHAVYLQPRYDAARMTQARIYAEDGKNEAAISIYTEMIDRFGVPSNPRAQRERAWLRFQARNWKAAIADGEAVLKIAPQDRDAMSVVGYAKFAQADYAGAADLLGKAADGLAATAAAFPLFVRHYALLRMNAPDERLATTSVGWKNAPWQQALAKFIAGQIDEGALEAAAKDTSNDGERAGRVCEMHFCVGLAHAQSGDKLTARLHFQSAAATAPKSYGGFPLAHAELERLK